MVVLGLLAAVLGEKVTAAGEEAGPRPDPPRRTRCVGAAASGGPHPPYHLGWMPHEHLHACDPGLGAARIAAAHASVRELFRL
ncbi:hypothetical protein E4K10_12875 [Streptomyces sp. T1317-0309]|nr:hypothetical protein E4K10_12875 [Streptomyces sp. T1317-0309]